MSNESRRTNSWLGFSEKWARTGALGCGPPPHPPPRLGRCLGNTLDLSEIPGEEGDEVIGFMDGPGAENNGFDLVSNHGRATTPAAPSRRTLPSPGDGSRTAVGK